MLPATFPQQNFIFNRPSSITEEECGVLPVCKATDVNGYPVIISFWKLSKEDLEEIQQTRGVWLLITGAGMPSVSLAIESPFNTQNT